MSSCSGYMPPEYLQHRLISKKFDVFSFGAIIIKMVAGNTGSSRRSQMPPMEFIKLVMKSSVSLSKEKKSSLSIPHQHTLYIFSYCDMLALRAGK